MRQIHYTVSLEQIGITCYALVDSEVQMAAVTAIHLYGTEIVVVGCAGVALSLATHRFSLTRLTLNLGSCLQLLLSHSDLNQLCEISLLVRTVDRALACLQVDRMLEVLHFELYFHRDTALY